MVIEQPPKNYNSKKKMKQIIAAFLIMLYLMTSASAQGELLKNEQSGGAFVYGQSTSEVYTSLAAFYTYTVQRKYEIGVRYMHESAKVADCTYWSDNNVFSIMGAGYINTGTPFNIKGSAVLSPFENNRNLILGATTFFNKSQSEFKVVPSVTVFTDLEQIYFSGSLGFKFGKAFSFIGSFNFTKIMDTSLISGISLGIIFSD